jgi:crossover junction endodeoxyribonuclease RusA
MNIVFPWFPKELSPNARIFWAQKAAIAKVYRKAWYVLALRVRERVDPAAPIALTVTFHPPDRRPRDLDNCIASIKSGMDGLADALGVNDRLFVTRYALSSEIAGTVVVQLDPAQRNSVE